MQLPIGHRVPPFASGGVHGEVEFKSLAVHWKRGTHRLIPRNSRIQVRWWGLEEASKNHIGALHRGAATEDGNSPFLLAPTSWGEDEKDTKGLYNLQPVETHFSTVLFPICGSVDKFTDYVADIQHLRVVAVDVETSFSFAQTLIELGSLAEALKNNAGEEVILKDTATMWSTGKPHEILGTLDFSLSVQTGRSSQLVNRPLVVGVESEPLLSADDTQFLLKEIESVQQNPKQRAFEHQYDERTNPAYNSPASLACSVSDAGTSSHEIEHQDLLSNESDDGFSATDDSAPIIPDLYEGQAPHIDVQNSPVDNASAAMPEVTKGMKKLNISFSQCDVSPASAEMLSHISAKSPERDDDQVLIPQFNTSTVKASGNLDEIHEKSKQLLAEIEKELHGTATEVLEYSDILPIDDSELGEQGNFTTPSKLNAMLDLDMEPDDYDSWISKLLGPSESDMFANKIPGVDDKLLSALVPDTAATVAGLQQLNCVTVKLQQLVLTLNTSPKSGANLSTRNKKGTRDSASQAARASTIWQFKCSIRLGDSSEDETGEQETDLELGSFTIHVDHRNRVGGHGSQRHFTHDTRDSIVVPIDATMHQTVEFDQGSLRKWLFGSVVVQILCNGKSLLKSQQGVPQKPRESMFGALKPWAVSSIPLRALLLSSESFELCGGFRVMLLNSAVEVGMIECDMSLHGTSSNGSSLEENMQRVRIHSESIFNTSQQRNMPLSRTKEEKPTHSSQNESGEYVQPALLKLEDEYNVTLTVIIRSAQFFPGVLRPKHRLNLRFTLPRVYDKETDEPGTKTFEIRGNRVADAEESVFNDNWNEELTVKMKLGPGPLLSQLVFEIWQSVDGTPGEDDSFVGIAKVPNLYLAYFKSPQSHFLPKDFFDGETQIVNPLSGDEKGAIVVEFKLLDSKKSVEETKMEEVDSPSSPSSEKPKVGVEQVDKNEDSPEELQANSKLVEALHSLEIQRMQWLQVRNQIPPARGAQSERRGRTGIDGIVVDIGNSSNGINESASTSPSGQVNQPSEQAIGVHESATGASKAQGKTAKPYLVQERTDGQDVAHGTDHVNAFSEVPSEKDKAMDVLDPRSQPGAAHSNEAPGDPVSSTAFHSDNVPIQENHNATKETEFTSRVPFAHVFILQMQGTCLEIPGSDPSGCFVTYDFPLNKRSGSPQELWWDGVEDSSNSKMRHLVHSTEANLHDDKSIGAQGDIVMRLMNRQRFSVGQMRLSVEAIIALSTQAQSDVQNFNTLSLLDNENMDFVQDCHSEQVFPLVVRDGEGSIPEKYVPEDSSKFVAQVKVRYLRYRGCVSQVLERLSTSSSEKRDLIVYVPRVGGLEQLIEPLVVQCPWLTVAAAVGANAIVNCALIPHGQLLPAEDNTWESMSPVMLKTFDPEFKFETLLQDLSITDMQKLDIFIRIWHIRRVSGFQTCGVLGTSEDLPDMTLLGYTRVPIMEALNRSMLSSSSGVCSYPLVPANANNTQAPGKVNYHPESGSSYGPYVQFSVSHQGALSQLENQSNDNLPPNDGLRQVQDQPREEVQEESVPITIAENLGYLKVKVHAALCLSMVEVKTESSVNLKSPWVYVTSCVDHLGTLESNGSGDKKVVVSSRSLTGHGCSPRWDYVFILSLRNPTWMEDTLNLNIWHSDDVEYRSPGADSRFLGTCEVGLAELSSSTPVLGWFQVHDSDKRRSGRMKVEVHYFEEIEKDLSHETAEHSEVVELTGENAQQSPNEDVEMVGNAQPLPNEDVEMVGNAQPLPNENIGSSCLPEDDLVPVSTTEGTFSISEGQQSSVDDALQKLEWVSNHLAERMRRLSSSQESDIDEQQLVDVTANWIADTLNQGQNDKQATLEQTEEEWLCSNETSGNLALEPIAIEGNVNHQPSDGTQASDQVKQPQMTSENRRMLASNGTQTDVEVANNADLCSMNTCVEVDVEIGTSKSSKTISEYRSQKMVDVVTDHPEGCDVELDITVNPRRSNGSSKEVALGCNQDSAGRHDLCSSNTVSEAGNKNGGNVFEEAEYFPTVQSNPAELPSISGTTNDLPKVTKTSDEPNATTGATEGPIDSGSDVDEVKKLENVDHNVSRGFDGGLDEPRSVLDDEEEKVVLDSLDAEVSAEIQLEKHPETFDSEEGKAEAYAEIQPEKHSEKFDSEEEKVVPNSFETEASAKRQLEKHAETFDAEEEKLVPTSCETEASAEIQPENHSEKFDSKEGKAVPNSFETEASAKIQLENHLERFDSEEEKRIPVSKDEADLETLPPKMDNTQNCDPARFHDAENNGKHMLAAVCTNEVLANCVASVEHFIDTGNTDGIDPQDNFATVSEKQVSGDEESFEKPAVESCKANDDANSVHRPNEDDDLGTLRTRQTPVDGGQNGEQLQSTLERHEYSSEDKASVKNEAILLQSKAHTRFISQVLRESGDKRYYDKKSAQVQKREDRVQSLKRQLLGVSNVKHRLASDHLQGTLSADQRLQWELSRIRTILRGTSPLTDRHSDSESDSSLE